MKKSLILTAATVLFIVAACGQGRTAREQTIHNVSDFDAEPRADGNTMFND